MGSLTLVLVATEAEDVVVVTAVVTVVAAGVTASVKVETVPTGLEVVLSEVVVGVGDALGSSGRGL